MSTQHLATREGRFYTHQEVWSDLQDVLHLLEAHARPRRGLFSAAVVLTYACLEAYVNFLGEEIFSAVWKADRDGSSSIGGTLAKLAFLCEQLAVPLDRTRAQYSTLRQLKRRRDRFAHPRTETRFHRIPVEIANRLRPIDSDYNRLLTRSFVQKAVAVVSDLADKLQAAAHSQFPHKVFGPKAFPGILSVRGISIDT